MDDKTYEEKIFDRCAFCIHFCCVDGFCNCHFPILDPEEECPDQEWDVEFQTEA